MDLIHNVENDLPDRSSRELEQERIDLAIAEFLAQGKQITEITPTPKKPVVSLTDQELVRQLVNQASQAKTLSEAAKHLNEPEDRCRRLAVSHRIPFRSKSFLNKRRASK